MVLSKTEAGHSVLFILYSLIFCEAVLDNLPPTPTKCCVTFD